MVDNLPDSLPAEPGTYALILILERAFSQTVGSLGTVSLAPGCYVYVGSALRGLAGRVGRHLRLEKPLRWHVDYLRRSARPVAVVWRIGRERRECDLANALALQVGASVPIRGFGSSDCRCAAHLFGFSGEPTLALDQGWRMTRLDGAPSGYR